MYTMPGVHLNDKIHFGEALPNKTKLTGSSNYKLLLYCKQLKVVKIKYRLK